MPSSSPTTHSSPEGAAPAQAAWQRGADGGWVLHVAGDWQGAAAATLPDPPAGADATLRIDAAALTGWDARFAAALWQQLLGLRRAGVEVDLGGLPPGLQQVLGLSLPAPGVRPAVAAPSPRPGRIEIAGLLAQAWWADARQTLGFVGELLQSMARTLRGRGDLRLADLAWQIEQAGPRSVPIVALVSAMVGLILAYMGAAQLARFGAKSFVADLMTVAVVREIAALLVGVILSGRVGAAYAAQLGSMRAGDELDALRTLGVDPMSHLVLPRMLALLLVAPLLTVFGAVVGMAVGWLAAAVIYAVPSAEYLGKSVAALDADHVLVGLVKGSVYGVLVALAGCRQGLYAGRSAQAVGDAVTQAVVKAIVWIVCAASVLTVVFQRFGI